METTYCLNFGADISPLQNVVIYRNRKQGTKSAIWRVSNTCPANNWQCVCVCRRGKEFPMYLRRLSQSERQPPPHMGIFPVAWTESLISGSRGSSKLTSFCFKFEFQRGWSAWNLLANAFKFSCYRTSHDGIRDPQMLLFLYRRLWYWNSPRFCPRSTFMSVMWSLTSEAINSIVTWRLKAGIAKLE
jgi:hypothetical protein